ncbi:MAG: OmpA family protein [Flavobacteriales bacterium]|nr:OmpA family protein [Flavobacteriales bacterium]
MKCFLCLVLTALTAILHAQTPASQKALNAYSQHKYANAIPLLQSALSVEKNENTTAMLHFALGESYAQNSMYEQSLHHFTIAQEKNYGPKTTLEKGKIEKILGQYTTARATILQYIEESPEDDLAKKILEGIEMAEKISKQKSPYTVNQIDEINSTERDFAPSLDEKGNLVFTSSRRATDKASQDHRQGEASSTLYISTLLYNPDISSAGKWSIPVPFVLDENRTPHRGASSFSKNGKEVYFTQCENAEQGMGCAIMKSVKTSDSTWSAPEIVIKADSGLTVGHPSLSPDGNKLFFSAQRSKNSDKDIFFVVKTDSTHWSAWREIPSVNTSSDELFPFIANNGRLYFSSSGHAGMGGLDIFYSDEKNGIFTSAINMGTPVNSSADDFSFVITEKGDGFFSSNRNGGMGKDDIYRMRPIPHLYAIQGVVIDNKTGLPLDNATVRIEGSNGSINTLSTDAKGIFIASPNIISEATTYKITVDKKHYLISSFSATTHGVDEEEFTNTPEGKLHTTQIIAEIDPMTKPIVLPRIEYDFDRATLRPEGKKALDILVVTLEENPSIVIELRAHTDHKGLDDYNLRLSDERAKSCVDYLISRGIDPMRLRSRGMGETEPFIIPMYFKSNFAPGTVLTESYISALKSPEKDEEARQYNRRTDFKVLGEIVREVASDYTPLEQKNIATTTDTTVSAFVSPVITYKIDTLPKTSSSTAVIDKEKEKTADKKVEFYTLKTGDNYGTVATFFGITSEDLRALNGGLRGISPFEGMVLKVCKTCDYASFDRTHHRVERAENTLEKILLATGMSKDVFLNLNKGFSEKDIRAGVLVIISEK